MEASDVSSARPSDPEMPPLRAMLRKQVTPFHFRVVEGFDDDLVIGADELEGRVDRANLVGQRPVPPTSAARTPQANKRNFIMSSLW